MIIDYDAQAIFLLTYKHSKSEWIPLSAQEYSRIAYKIREKGLSGPKALLSLKTEEISKICDIDDSMALRIRNLLDLGGTASLYIERIFNQGISLITRTDPIYPSKFKTLLRDNTPPYFCLVGNKDLLSDTKASYIVSANDISKLNIAEFPDEAENLICLIDATRYIKPLSDWRMSWGKIIIISSIGVSKLIRQPGIRESLQLGNAIIVSTNVVEAVEPNYHGLFLYLMAFAISSTGTVVYLQQNMRAKQILDQIRGYDYLRSRLIVESMTQVKKGIVMIKTEHREDKQQPNTIDEISDTKQTTIHTIGHSNHEISKFLELLELHNIDMLVDIRSVPRSKYAPQFDQNTIKKSLKDSRIQYKNMGSSLGGRPDEKDVLSSTGKIVREYIEQKDWYQQGIQELIDLVMKGKRVAFMCSEEDPSHCHRGYIVSNTLIEKGIQVLHIRANGAAQDLGLLNSSADQMEIPL